MRLKSLLLSFVIIFSFSTSVLSQDSWIQTAGPEGGNIYSMIKAQNGNIVISTSGGIYYSSNNGTTWQLSDNSPVTTNTFTMASDGTLYTSNWLLWRSQDNGVTWEQVANVNSSRTVLVLKNGTILNGTSSDGILMSTDNGQSWGPSNNGITNPTDALVLGFVESPDGSYVYAAINNQGVFRSSNGGTNWSLIATYNSVQAMFVTSTDSLYVGSYPDGISITGDHGNTWITRNQGGAFSFVSAFSEDDHGTVYCGVDNYSGFYRQNLDQWERVQPAGLHTPVKAFIPLPNGNFYLGTGGEGFAYYGSDQINFYNTQLKNTDINALEIMGDHTLLAATLRSGLFRSDDYGNNWANIFNIDYPGNEITDVKWDSVEQRIYIASYGNGIFYQEPNNGNQWIPINDGLASNYINSLAIDRLNNFTYAGSDQGMGLYRLTPGSTTWENVNNGLSFGDYESIESILITHDDKLYIGTRGNQDQVGLFLSPNHGDTWAPLTAGLPDKSEITCLVEDLDGIIYAGITNNFDSNGRGVYKYSPSQAKWIYIGLSTYNVDDLIVSNENRLYVTGSFDVNVLNRVSGEFEPAFEYELNIRPTALAIPDDQHLYAGTLGGGVFVSDKTVEYQNYVTFQVNMNVQINRNQFNPVEDKIQLQLDFNYEANGLDMTDNNQDGIYELTGFVNGEPADTLFFKYMILKTSDNRVWEQVPARKVILTGTPITIDPVFFDDNDGTNPFVDFNAGALTDDMQISSGVAWINSLPGLAPDAIVLTAPDSPNSYYTNDAPVFLNYTGGEFGSANNPSNSVSVGDYDNDGLPDVAISTDNTAPTVLYHNNGDRQFVDISNTLTPITQYPSRGLSWTDFNNDGLLDLFIANGLDNVNIMFKNQGNGSFAMTAHAPSDLFNSFGCAWADFDDDNNVDLYVVNGDGQANNMYMNNGDGTFTKVTNGPQIQSLSDNRGCSVADVDNDGDMDIYVTSYNDRNKMYINDGSGNFTELTGKPPVMGNRPSTGSVFGDFDNDGRIDLYVANEGGNQLFLNKGNLDFEEINFGPGVNDDEASAGVATADFNQDGKLDLLISNTAAAGARNKLLRNAVNSTKHWLKIKLKGTESNASGIGAKILLYSTISGNNVLQKREISGQTGFQGQNSLIAHFGLGSAPQVDSIRVIWPSGNVNDTTAVAADQFITINEKSTTAPTVSTDSSIVATNNMVTLYATVNPNGLETNAYFEYGTDTSYFNSVAAAPSTLYGDTPQVVSATVGPLTSGSYQFRINASNEKGNTKGQLLNFQILFTMPDLSIGNPENVSVRSATLRGFCNPKNMETNVYYMVNINGTLTKFPYPANPINGNDLLDIFMSVTGLDPNTEYTYFLQAENQNDTYKTQSRSFKTLSYPDIIQLNTDINFPSYNSPSDYQSSDYRLIGIPGNDSPRVEDMMSGSHQIDWDCYWDNGNPNDNFFEPFDDTNNIFSFKAGRGFWIISKSGLSINTQTDNVPLNENSQYEIPLHDGWNIISNPFNQSLSWVEVKAVNGDNLQPIFRYTGSFQQAVNFLPFVGYYFMNDNNLSSIRIPFPVSSSALPKQPEQSGWRINIGLQSGPNSEQCISFGVDDDALSGKDKYDYYKPRALGQQPGVSFYRPEWNDTYPVFATDIRPVTDEKQSWDFSVNGALGQTITLTFDEANFLPAALSIYLLDAEHGSAQDLKTDNIYRFVATQPETKLKIVVGPKQDIQSEIDAVVPQVFRLESNYPNPFNPQTAIPIALPKESDVRLEIFDVLGKHIQTLHSGLLNSGRHVFLWNGKNSAGRLVPSGVYFYQVTLNGRKHYSKKMILMK